MKRSDNKRSSRQAWTEKELKVVGNADVDSYEEFIEVTGNPHARSHSAWKQQRYGFGLPAMREKHEDVGRNVSFGKNHNVLMRKAERADVPPDVALEHANEEIERLRQQLGEVRGERRKAREAEAWADVVTRAVHRSIPRLPIPQPMDFEPVKIPDKFDEQEMILVLSDLQIGSEVRSEETGGLAQYSFETYEKQVIRLEEAITAIKSKQLSHVPIRRLTIFGLGDFVDGDAIFEGHPWEVDRHLIDQIVEGSQALALCLSRLSSLFPEIAVKVIPGNHGRLGKKREAAPIGRNADLLFARFWEMQLSEYENIRFDISPSWWMLVQRMDTRFLLIHGEDVRSWMSIPYYGFERAERRWFGLIQLNLPEDVRGAAFHWLVAGHHHTPACLSTTQGGKILLNGSWPGGSNFSAKTLQAANRPSQWLLALHRTRGVTSMWDLNLEVESKRTPIYVDDQ